MKIYTVIQSGIWYYEIEDTTIKTFKSFEKALEYYKELVDMATADLRELASDDELIEDEILDIEKEYASFEGYKEGNYAELNCCIRIDKQEIE